MTRVDGKKAMSDNKLEIALRAAAKDAGQRPEFYRVLLESDVWALGSAERNAAGEATSLKLTPWQTPEGQAILPIFSSMEQWQLSIDEQTGYVRLNARDLLEATRGDHLVLNPNADYGKTFTPQEIEALLDGSLFQRGDMEVVEATRQVLLGQPVEYPQALADGLASYFGGVPEVQAAYLVMMEDPGREPSRSLLVGIETQAEEKRLHEIFGEGGLVVTELLEAGEFADFIRLDDSPFAQSMRANGRRFYPAEG